MVPRFRCWDEPNKIMRFNDEIVIWNDQVYINEKKELDSRIKGYSCLPKHLMQSTGLKDKNGVEVFQGDIVRCTRGCPHEVVWLKEYAGMYVGGMPAWYLSGLSEGYAWTGDEEIIGNIYENPELLDQDNA